MPPFIANNGVPHKKQSVFRRSPVTGAAALLAGACLLTASSFVGGMAATAEPDERSPFSARQLGQYETDLTAGRYIVTLADDAAATYKGGESGLMATAPEHGEKLDARAPAVQDYAEFLEGQQKDVAATVNAGISYSYTLSVNAFAANLSAEQAAKLASDKRVVNMVPDELAQVTAVPSTEFLGLDGADGVWSEVGGTTKAGDGVVVGVLDTGIAPENPSFAGDRLSTTPGDQPYLNGNTVTYKKSDGQTFTGVCEEGAQFASSSCNTKLVGARYFVDGFGAGNIAGPAEGEYLSPRDGDGHGSHTASTAAGNNDVDASINGTDFGKISGVAPSAKISAYKVCWTGVESTGCATSDMLAAIDQAIGDGVDVINFSIGGGAAQTVLSAIDQAFFGAASAGIFIAASAGNSGPGASTLDHASPWYTTVAASTIPSYEATAILGDGKSEAGASITVNRTPGAPALEAPLVRGDKVAREGSDPATALLCGPDSLDPTLVVGTIVFCKRGEFDRVAKSAEVKRAGGVGMLLVNPTDNSVDLDDHSVPTVHLGDPAWGATYEYAGSENAQATFVPHNSTGVTPPTPQIAGFSSRGPVLAGGSDILKPDLTAPGVGIIADGANAQGAAPTWKFSSGTSMSSPHVAGLAALYLGERPTATPAEIKSAMMTTAYDTRAKDGSRSQDPFAQGAGHVDPTKFFNPGLLYLNTSNDWLAYLEGVGYKVGGKSSIDPSDLNLASIAIGSLVDKQTVKRTVTATQPGTFDAQPVSLPGIDVAVSPSTLTFDKAGESREFTVSFTRTNADVGAFAKGSLEWVSQNNTVVRSPIVVKPVAVEAPAGVAWSANGASGGGSFDVTPGATADIPLEVSGFAAGKLVADPGNPNSGHTGFGRTGEAIIREFTVEPETRVARFDLTSVNRKGDFDLFVYQMDEHDNPVKLWASASESLDERVTIANPSAGRYLLVTEVYAGADAFDITTYSVAKGAGVGSFTATPSLISGEQGKKTSLAFTWADIEVRNRYLGVVDYADSGLSTLVQLG